MSILEQNEKFENEIIDMIDKVIDDTDDIQKLGQLKLEEDDDASTAFTGEPVRNHSPQGKRFSTSKEIPLSLKFNGSKDFSQRHSGRFKTIGNQLDEPVTLVYDFNKESQFNYENNSRSVFSVLNNFQYFPSPEKLKFEDKSPKPKYTTEETLEKIMSKEEMDFEDYLILKGKFSMMLQIQNSCRILQNCLKKTNYVIQKALFLEISKDLVFLMTNQYANYFCPKLYSGLQPTERIVFLSKIKDSFNQIANHKNGTYPLQAIVKNVVFYEEKLLLLQSIDPCFLEMCYDPYGVHVIEKIIDVIEEELLQKYFEIIVNNYLSLSCNVNGLCVAKRIILKTKNINIINHLQEILSFNAVQISQHQSATYVLHVALEHWRIEMCYPILSNIYPVISKLSMLRYSSSVIEKFFEKGGKEVVFYYYLNVEKSGMIVEILKNNFGNYVLQKAVKFGDLRTQVSLISTILKNLEWVGDRWVISKWNLFLRNHIVENNLVQYFSRENSFGENNRNNLNNLQGGNVNNELNVLNENLFISNIMRHNISVTNMNEKRNN